MSVGLMMGAGHRRSASQAAAAQSFNNFDVQTLTAGQRPPSNWRPYADDSPWNTPIDTPDNPSVYVNSTNCIAQLQAGPGSWSENIDTGLGPYNSDNRCTWFATSTDTLVTIRVRNQNGNGGANWGTTNLELQQIRIPSQARPSGYAYRDSSNIAQGDRHLSIVQPNGDVAQMWKMETDTYVAGSPTTWWCTFGSLETINGSGVGLATGSNLGLDAGIIREEELWGPGEINHAIFCTSPVCHSTIILPPATKVATGSGLADTPPIGSRFQYIPTVATINAQSWSAPMKKIARCLHNYGAILSDTGGGTKIALKFEDDNVYEAYGTAYQSTLPYINNSTIQLQTYVDPPASSGGQGSGRTITRWRPFSFLSNLSADWRIVDPQGPYPSAPTITSVTAADGQVTVAFGAPFDDGGSPITQYEVIVP